MIALHRLKHIHKTIQVMPRINGKSFRCKCGCNVFTKKIIEPDKYTCNACNARYIGE